MSTRHVALLRGINLGGRNKLPMKDLKAVFEKAGARGVKTYIQSGNVLFDAEPTAASGIADAVVEGIHAGFGYTVPVVLRTEEQLRTVALSHPFDGEGIEPKTLHVAFLDAVPDEERVRALDPDRSPPDVFEVRGQEVFLYYPNGAARSKLTNAYLDSVLGGVSTFRNWRTVQKLVDLLDD